MHMPLNGLATVPVPPGAAAAGVLAAADGAAVVRAAADGPAVVLVPGERVAPAPGALPWLAHPASTARHAAAASAAAERVVIIVSPWSPGYRVIPAPAVLRHVRLDDKEAGPMVLMQEVPLPLAARPNLSALRRRP